MVSRASACLGAVMGAAGCIPYYDFTPCEETGTCNWFDASERADLATESATDAGAEAGMDVASEATSDAAKDAVSDADAGDVRDDVSDVSMVSDAGDAPDAVTCAEGTADCDGVAANGCEVDTRTSAAHCGACRTACVAPVGGGVRCAAGRCEVSCDAGSVRAGDACAPIAPPRLVAPLSPHTVTSQTPRLRWALAPGTDGARIELCRERACATVAQRFEATGTSATVPTALAPGAWFWRAAGKVGDAAGATYSATWEFFVGHRSAPVNTAWGQATDVNGDGYADLVFAAGDTVYTYAGSARGLPTTPTTFVPSPGRTVQAIAARGGDVDGDGFADVLLQVAATGEPLGVAMLYRGGASGIGGSAARMYDPSAQGVALLGDVNGDGYGDLALNDALLLGTPGGPMDTRAAPPASDRVIFPVGDLNGDGLADAFRCTLMRFRATCTAAVGTTAGAFESMGATIEFFGGPTRLSDVDGDGRADFGALLPSVSMPGQWIGYGGATATTMVYLSDGTTIVSGTVGDMNRDGLTDSALVTTDAMGSSTGEYVVFGSQERRWDGRRQLSSVPGIPVRGLAIPAAVGDTDGDRFDEFAVVDQISRDILVYGASAVPGGLPDRRITAHPTSLVFAR